MSAEEKDAYVSRNSHRNRDNNLSGTSAGFEDSYNDNKNVRAFRVCISLGAEFFVPGSYESLKCRAGTLCYTIYIMLSCR